MNFEEILLRFIVDWLLWRNFSPVYEDFKIDFRNDWFV